MTQKLTAQAVTAQVVPYSSIVGTGVMVLDDGGSCVAMVTIARMRDNLSKETQQALANLIARAINQLAQCEGETKMSKTYAEQLRDGMCRNVDVGSDVLKGAADALDRQAAEIDRLKDGLRAIHGYASDTLSGPSIESDRSSDWMATWYKDGISVMKSRARRLLLGYSWSSTDDDGYSAPTE